MSWTDYATPSDVGPPPVSTHLLDLNALRQVIQLMEQIRQGDRSPEGAVG